ncbi:MAG: DUF4271 domain-containing protein [Bacteroidales bacterium]
MEKVLPADSLWEAGSKIISSKPPFEEFGNTAINDVLLSLIILAFFVILILFSREILTVIPSVLKSTFNLKNHYKIEEKLSLSNMRNVVFLVSLIYFPVIVTIMAGSYIQTRFSIYTPLFLIVFLAILVSLGIVKKLIFKLLSWLNRDKNTFVFLEKVGYNHIILATIVTFPSLLAQVVTNDYSGEIQIYAMIICVLPVYILYLFRSGQIITGQRYSHFFYILYLCGAEFLPIVLLVHFILSL